MLCGPRIWLKVIKDRVESKLTFIHRDEELAKRVRVALVEWITGLAKSKLGLDIGRGNDFVTLKDIGLRAVLEAKLMDKDHAAVGDQADQSVLGDKVNGLL